jgi:hypothetical protein
VSQNDQKQEVLSKEAIVQVCRNPFGVMDKVTEGDLFVIDRLVGEANKKLAAAVA